jgi:O-antigen ligase
MELRQSYKKYKYYPLLLMALLLPFNVGVALVLMISLGMFFILGEVKEGIAELIKNKWTYVFIGFFFLHALAYFFGTNKQEALTAIEIKLGFFAFPLLMFAQKFNRSDIRFVLRTFAFATALCTLFNICRALCFYYFFQDGQYLFYSSFSFFMHPSYFAMYAVFALIIWSTLGLNYFKNNTYNLLCVVVMSSILGLGVFMSASKMGMLSLFISLPIVLFYMLYKRKKHLLLISISICIGISSFFILRSNYAPVQRLKNAFNFAESTANIDKTTSESNAVRVLIWSEAVTLIKQHLLFGISPGDVNDELYKAYERAGMTGAFEKKLNAHNQFLQTTLGTGLLGSVLLIVLSLGLIITGFIRKNRILTMFGLIVTVNFLVESMLQTQAGALFFVFFAPLVLIEEPTVNKSNN